MTSQHSPTVTTDQPLRPDGGDDATLRVGASAEVIGEDGKLFARLGDRPVLIDPIILNWTVVEENREGDEIHLDDLAGNALEMLFTRVDELDFDACVEALYTHVGIDEQTARVLLLFEGFEFDVDEIATELDISRETVNDELYALYERYDEQRIIAEVQDAHPEIEQNVVAAFVLAEGFRWDENRIAAELDVAEDELAALVEDAPEALEKTLQEIIQSIE